MKLEIGSGQNPQPGYKHLDIDPNFPQIDYVSDLAKDGIPLPDASCDEILANHVIEHIPWRKLPFVLSECSRVLRPGGSMVIRTPDLEFICRSYLEKEITPEWPGDMDKMEEVFGSFGPSQWAIVKLFSGQDYESNFHFVCLDFEAAEQLLLRNGFSQVERVHLLPVFSPGELQLLARK